MSETKQEQQKEEKKVENEVKPISQIQQQVEVSSLNLKPYIQNVIESYFKFTLVTKQQEIIIKGLQENKNLCIQTPSGTGKTLAYIIGLVNAIDETKVDVVQAIILANSNELCQQIWHILKKFVRETKISLAMVTENTRYNDLSHQKPTILIGIPNKMVLALKKGTIQIETTKYLLIDECDYTIEKFKYPPIIKEEDKNVEQTFDALTLLEKITPKPVIALFGTTLNKDVKSVIQLKILTQEKTQVNLHNYEITAPNVKHYYVLIPNPELKMQYLVKILECISMKKAFIFSQDAVVCSDIINEMDKCGFKDSELYHYQIDLQDRFYILRNLLEKSNYRFIVTTDLLARGIDFQDYDLVINYDLPKKYEAFIHRTGRVGRFGTPGKAITFISSEEDVLNIENIQNRYGIEMTQLPVDLSTIQ